MNPTHAAALDYIERGWSVIPMAANTKKPLIKWEKYQNTLPTADEVDAWFERWPDAVLALVTGAISGVVVVDADNPEAEKKAHLLGFTATPVVVHTKRGKHFYWRHPRDGVRRGPRMGNNVRRTRPDWPECDGLDFRGDGSYALLPPSPNYTWVCEYGADPFDSPPVWRDYRPVEPGLMLSDEWNFDALDLSSIPAMETWVSEWDKTAAYVRERYPTTLKLPSNQGNGRNQRLLLYASERVMFGDFGDELRQGCRAFMREFYAENLSDAELEATCSSVEAMERRNHPERFDADGNYIYSHPSRAATAPEPTGSRLITAADAARLLAESDAESYFIEPWLKRGTIVQLYGYTGSGKSLVLQHFLYAAVCGAPTAGPFDVGQRPKVLYLDYENGPATIGLRLSQMLGQYGDAGEGFSVWAPFVSKTIEEHIDLRNAKGIEQLQLLLKSFRPDVVVIDTIRSAWTGLKENDADSWSPINELALRLRNAGLSVILVHHGNKPGENGVGREAGSTNQLTVVETQMRIAKVFRDAEEAKVESGIFDGNYPKPVWPQLEAKLPAHARLNMVAEIRYGKVRTWTDAHDRVQWVGFGSSDIDDSTYMVASSSSKQKARALAAAGFSIPDIAASINRPARAVSRWLAPPGH